MHVLLAIAGLIATAIGVLLVASVVGYAIFGIRWLLGYKDSWND